MKKILLIILFYSSFSFSQEKPLLESIIDINIRNTERDTIIYKFENGKLKSKKEGSHSTTFFNYNSNGLVGKESRVFYDGSSQDVNYTYNNDGYITEILKSEKKDATAESVPWYKTEILYAFTSSNNYIINSSSQYTKNPGSDKNLRDYMMKDNILTASDKQGKIYQEKKYKIENGNIVELEKVKPSKENYVLEFKFDDKENIFKIIFKNLYGDKYFINQMVARPEIYSHYGDLVNQNNSISLRKAKSKTIAFSEPTSTILYNKNNLPVEIKIDSDPGYGNLITIKYQN